MTHVGCWMTYYVHKARIECPICHKVYETPQQEGIITTTLDITSPQPIRVVVVSNNDIEENVRCRNDTRKVSLIILFAVSIFFISMHYAFK